MEGVVGVVTSEQLGPQGFEYARFREFMTQEVNAAIEGCICSAVPPKSSSATRTATVKIC